MTAANIVEIEVRSKDKSKQGFDNANKTADRFGGTMSKLKGVAGAAAAGVAVGAVTIGKKMYETGQHMDMLDQKSHTVFQGSLPKVKAWADGNAKAFGLSGREVTGMAANLADLLKPMGFTADQAAGMSMKMGDLSGALSRWSGGTKSAAEVSDILNSAMMGETDGLKGLGISIQDSDIQARLAEKGQSKLTGAARKQAEAVAVQELIIAKSTDAQAAWTNGGKKAAEAQNSTKASVATLGESFSKALQPALESATKVLTKVSDWAEKNPDKLKTIGIIVGGVLVTAFAAWAVSAAAAAVATIAATWPILAVLAAIGLLVAGIVLLVKHWDKIKEKLTEVGGKIVDFFKALPGKITGALGDAGKFLLDKGKDIVTGLKNGIVAIATGIGKWVYDNVISPVITPWVNAAKWLVQAGKDFVGGLKNGIVAIASAIGKWVGDNIISPVVGAFDKAGDWLVQKGKDFVGGLKDGIVAIVTTIGKWERTNIIDPVIGAFSKAGDWLVQKGKDFVGGLKDGIIAIVNTIGKWERDNIISPVVGAFSKAGTWLVQAGKNFIAGLKNGILALLNIGRWIYDNVISPLVGRFTNGANGAGTWLVQAGKNLIAGFKNGITALLNIGRWIYDNVISPLVARFTNAKNGAGKWLYQSGKNVLAGFLNGLKEIWTKVKEFVSGIGPWIKDHKGPVSLDGKLLVPAGKALMNGFLGGLKSGAGPAWAFVSKVGGKSVSMLKGALGGIGSHSLPVVGKGVERWRATALEALKLTGSPSSWINSLLRRMNQESGGNPNAINLWDSNAKHGDPSRGLMQTIMGTFNAYKRAGVPSSSIWDPLENIIAAINYANARYGAAPRGWDRPGGYKLGTPWVPNDQLAFLHKGEAVIPASANRRGGGGGPVIVLEFRSDGTPHMNWLMGEVRRYVKAQGGSVQTVLGAGAR